MVRKIISVVAGVVAGFVLVFIGDSVCMRLFTPPIGLNPLDQEQYSAYVTSIPTYVMVVMFTFWVLSAFCGGLLSALVHKAAWKQVSLITGGILLAASILNMVNLPHPTWMVITTVAMYLPVAYLGGMLVGRKKVQ